MKKLLFKLFFGNLISLDYIHKELCRLYPEYTSIHVSVEKNNLGSSLRVAAFIEMSMEIHVTGKNFNEVLSLIKEHLNRRKESTNPSEIYINQ